MPVLLTDMSEPERAAIISPRTIRKVWAHISRTPRTTHREMAKQLKMPISTVHYALLRLRDAGYVEWEPKECRTMRVLVPFVVTKELR